MNVPLPLPGESSSPGTRSARLLLPALLCAIVSTFLFQAYPTFALPVYLSGVLWLGIGAPLSLYKVSSLGTHLRSISRSPAFLTALLLIFGALIFRTYHLAHPPYGIWYDEAQNIIESRSIAENSAYRPVFIADRSQLPAFSFYLAVPLLSLFDFSIYGLRLHSAVCGTAAVAATGLLAYFMFGRSTALFTLGILAFMRWHVTFSRFGMVQVVATFFAPLALLLFFRALHHRCPLRAAAAGLCIGLALQTYFWTVALAGVFIAAAFHAALTRRIRCRELLRLIAPFALGFLIAYLPMIGFIAENSTAFFERFHKVGEFSPRAVGAALAAAVASKHPLALLLPHEWPSLPAPLPDLMLSIKKHLCMFHVAGDNNGRHNLPGAPMLDPITGAAFILGLIVAVRRITDTRFFTLLAWLGVCLAAAIFSLSFEAPQAGRSSGAAGAVAVIAAVPLGALADFLYRRGLYARLAAAGCAMLLIGAVGYQNWRVYFNAQVKNHAVWGAYSSIETRIGEALRDEAPDVAVFAPESFAGGPTEELLAPPGRTARPFQALSDLPLRDASNGAIVAALDADPLAGSLIEALYPGSLSEPIGSAERREASLYRISQSDIAALYAVNVTCDGAAFTVKTSPLSLPAACTRSKMIELEGALDIREYGEHILRFDPHRLAIGGREIVGPESGVNRALSLTLPIGLHLFSARFEGGEAALREAALTAPGNAPPIPLLERLLHPRTVLGGLRGDYAACGAGERCDLRFSRIDRAVGHYFHLLPLPRPFRIIWQGALKIDTAGTYYLAVHGIDTLKVTLDNRLILESNINEPDSVEIRLAEGLHPLTIEYEAISGYSQAYFEWRKPGEAKPTVVPPQNLVPTLDDSAE